ncbi:STAS domain-containing protein [Methylotuvimicrobium buryatense]|uniref:STAS domain-containing protein n=1 Tax=Methylotuvimicrobium buryatense TaxID=95641 RepID=A0A4P9USD9_METBY|nr:STAS domain-containing protein [Methylotuvimicrobium buryatense]QCW82636.1 STAS domain-containing protein [Methylotuvimicrobium buryatense]
MKIPILRLGRILLTSVQIDLSDNDVLQFQSDVVAQISEVEALGIAIDISALDVVDSYMARVLSDTAGMARMLGAEVIISGIQPFVAMTLIEMGRGLIGADCVFNLEQAVERLNERIAERGDKFSYLRD